jgi:D-glycero-D-manno-heptose 1,7-bisphosphate phosphatase
VVKREAQRRAVFLDRDGVINRAVVRDGKPYPPDSIAELEILPGVPQALAALREAGFLNVVVTNQPDVATGKQRREVVEAMHALLARELALDEIKVCYHSSADGCACRKPKPGMLLTAAEDHGIDLGSSYVVGDRWRDIAAGQAAGCRAAYFIDYGYSEQQPAQPFFPAESLAAAARRILADVSSTNKSTGVTP